MEIEFYGANCFRIKTKNTVIVIDDNLSTVGAKTVVKEKEVPALLVTNSVIDTTVSSKSARLVLDGPGEYEVGDVSVVGRQVRAHMDEEDAKTGTVYQCTFDNKTVTILGHVHPEINDGLQELAGGTDVLIVPVGGNGYTLDAVGATQIVKKLEPEIVVPAHYEDNSLSFEVPAASLDEFIKIGALPAAEAVDVLKLGKVAPELAGRTHLQIVNKK